MFGEVELYVRIHIEHPDKNDVFPWRLLLSTLLRSMLKWKSTEDYGYFLAITNLKSIGNGELDESRRTMVFPVVFMCRTVLPVTGEIMLGVVHIVLRSGVFLKTGPMKYIYLSAQKMPNYHYVDEENPMFLSDDLSRIEKDVVIRFRVFAVRWTKENEKVEREFMVLACLDGNCLGPISSAGCEDFDL